MKQNDSTQYLPPLVELGLETVLCEIEELRELMEALAQFSGPLTVIVADSPNEVLQ